MILEKFWRGLKASRSGRPLDPPATPAELDWWKRARGRHWRHLALWSTLVPQVPLFVGLGYMRGWAFVASWHGLRLIAGFAVITAISGASQWRVMRKTRFRQELIAKRLREAIVTPHDDPPDALLPEYVSRAPGDE